ncbi:MAG TPA: hypothetical protein VFC63_07435 [Blastocatellia bacterium]|nr:hypothetical protein [Blastocatellia bacterium]
MFRKLIVSAILVIGMSCSAGHIFRSVYAQDSSQYETQSTGPDFCYYPWYRRMNAAGLMVLITLGSLFVGSVITSFKLLFTISNAKIHFLKNQFDRLAKLRKRKLI